MKLIPESSAFDVINSALSFDSVDGCFIGRVESYSCKMVGPDKALYKKFSNSQEAGIHDLQALSPPRDGLATSPYQNFMLYRSQCVPSAVSSSTATGSGATAAADVAAVAGGSSDSESEQHEDKIMRKTLFYLVSTLNAAFYPDYDFSNASSREFSMEHSLQHVMNSVDRQLTVLSKTQLLPVSERMWAAIDEAIVLSQCQIYTYNPDENSDPYSDDGCLWSFNYFFYNVHLKRIVFLTCRLVSNSSTESNHANSDYYMDSDVEVDPDY